jgi:hypothetical protein
MRIREKVKVEFHREFCTHWLIMFIFYPVECLFTYACDWKRDFLLLPLWPSYIIAPIILSNFFGYGFAASENKNYTPRLIK